MGAIYRARRDCKSTANIEFAVLLAFFVFCSVEKKASKKSIDFLESGKTYVVYLQNYVLFYTEYVLTRYIFLRKKTKFRTFLKSQNIKKFISTNFFSFLPTDEAVHIVEKENGKIYNNGYVFGIFN